MGSIIRRRGALLAILCSSLLLTGAMAEGDPDVVLQVEWGVGSAGFYREGRWTPIMVTATAVRSDIDGTIRLPLPFADERDTTFSRRIVLQKNVPYRTFLYAYVGHGCAPNARPPTVEIVDNRGRPVGGSPPRHLQPIERRTLVGIVQRNVSGIARGADVVAVDLSTDRIPDRWIGLEPFDLLVLADPDIAAFPSRETLDAIVAWVRNGGRIVLSASENWNAIAASPLGALLPGTIAESREIPFPRAIANFAGTAIVHPPDRLLVSRLTDARGKVLLESNGLPLIVRAPAGLGEIVFLAFNPSRPPFRRWEGMAALWQETSAMISRRERPATDNDNHYRRAIESFPFNQTFPLWQTLALCLGYLLVIGPLDYLLLRKIRRFVLTWVTIPLWATLFVGIAYAFSSARWGNRTMIQGGAVVDVLPRQNAVRGFSIAALYAPSSDDVTLSTLFGDGYVVPWVLQTPATGSGGRCEIDRELHLRDYRMHTNSITSFLSRWRSDTLPPFDVRVTARNDGFEIVNKTGSRIVNCSYIHDGKIRPVGDLSPDATVTIARNGNMTGDPLDHLSSSYAGSHERDFPRRAMHILLENSLADPRKNPYPFETESLRETSILSAFGPERHILMGWMERPPPTLGVSSGDVQRDEICLLRIHLDD